MKKRGFSLVELIVAFAVFLAAFIPIMDLTRNTNLLISKTNSKNSGDIGGIGTEGDEYTGNILNDFIKQVELRGYTFSNSLIPNNSNTGSKTYRLNKITSTNSDTGCIKGQYEMNPDDDLTKDPSNKTANAKDKMCFTQTTDDGDFDEDPVVLTVTRGQIKNLTTLKYSDSTFLAHGTNIPANPPFIKAEATFNGKSKNIILTPFQ